MRSLRQFQPLNLAESATQTSRQIRDPGAQNSRPDSMLNWPTKGSTILPSPFSTVEVCMPHYEFFCNACKKFFDKILSLSDYEEGEVQCPHCDSKNVEQRWSAFTTITSKKSA